MPLPLGLTEHFPAWLMRLQFASPTSQLELAVQEKRWVFQPPMAQQSFSFWFDRCPHSVPVYCPEPLYNLIP